MQIEFHLQEWEVQWTDYTATLHFFYIKKKIIKWFTHGWKAFGFENACVNQLANKYYFNKVNILYLRDITEVERSTKLCPFCSESLSTFKTTLKTQLSEEHSYTYTYAHVYNVLINCDLIIVVVGEGKTKKNLFLALCKHCLLHSVAALMSNWTHSLTSTLYCFLPVWFLVVVTLRVSRFGKTYLLNKIVEL